MRSSTNMFSAGFGASGLGVVFQSMRNGRETDGVGARKDTSLG